MADPVSLAITVALTAAQMAIAASQHIEGPRLKDLSTTVADYGTPLNYLLGTCWVTGVCFYAEPIAETVEERKGKGGKQTNYTYAGTFAIAVADQAVGSIRKIKFDGHLVYDATSALETYPLADDYALASHIRFYLGSAAQNPDPRMLATIVARDGAGACPAYRGVSYIFFEDIPLEKLGNRLPIVTIEVSTAALSGTGTVVLDFENADYRINGASVALADVLVAGGGLGFSYSDIIAGVGWQNPAAYGDSIGFLSAAAFAALGAGAGVSGTVTADFDLIGVTDPGTGVFLAALMSNSFGVSTRWGFDMELVLSGAAGLLFDHAILSAPVAMAATEGLHAASFTLAPAALVAAIDGGVPTTTGTPALFTPTQLYFQPGGTGLPAQSASKVTIKRITLAGLAP